ncbi:MAG TPA: biopolymer transporter ExbD [Planctomycetaceae bacterium]|nr:biopolymer transporter ExbD [Planctomycetaceae bacterium]
MKIPSQMRNHGLRFNLTPMIDIVFLLIIFFLVASYLAGTESSEAIELAPAESGEAESSDTANHITVTVTDDDQLHIGGNIVSPLEFEAMLEVEGGKHPADLEVRIRGDRRVQYRVIEPLLTACARLGIRRVKFNVLPTGE